MARRDPSFWYTLGRTVETAVSALPSESGDPGFFGRERGPRANGRPIDGILTGAASAFAASRVSRVASRRRPGLRRLVRGAVAGAGAAGILMAARFLLTDGEEEERPEDTAREATDELLAGAGRGVVYAGLVNPWLPGPPAMRGALAGTIDYLASPWGGLYGLLRPLSPVRKVPVASVLLETGDAEEDPYLAFLLQGVMLGLFYGEDDDG